MYAVFQPRSHLSLYLSYSTSSRDERSGRFSHRSTRSAPQRIASPPASAQFKSRAFRQFLQRPEQWAPERFICVGYSYIFSIPARV
ncbi:hypothetical protein FA15DRAFT_663368 [Coprinopsis marcescibilis]|uniref:Uncharacterized protein n=1 Tax=Coprinopsis marcescibilis TaxID=230819 RepID=A0A5C3LB71_COPMA|nr:hypothetical protein FA15DRAFT_663368 [Coprinopsis marcescibilis]